MLSCDCDFDFTWKFFTEDWRKCRKPRRCSECWREIVPGERYCYSTGKGDGQIWAFNTCSHCDAATRYIKAVSACWCYVLGGRWDENDDFEGEPLAVRRLAVAARRGWRRRRGPHRGELYPVPWVPTLTQETAP